MQIAEIMKKMIAYSGKNRHDINHFIKVWTYARTIGKLEGLDERTQRILETAAIMHDIACPLCREKYGNTDGKAQEAEGMILAEDFLKDCGLPDDENKRIIYLIGHHHTLTNIDGYDYQILIEADYLVNADEKSYSSENIHKFRERIFKTKSGIDLLKSMYT
ncbi:HD domain-containing protein [Treponema parvum]|uniref:HD domain-containing protein n=1 Tax=Treponema parvum TaxID=138851 RepID=A0A975ICZ0_9SPIR|nr:HD domain-containing protein [Treponema parvum]QTQ12208.1 HD domain-containing protein [Treponema parvum]QTQ15809.1 HD domain-containing protein [Treponema parvum]